MKRRDFIKTTSTAALGGLIIPRWLQPILAQSKGGRDILNDRIIILINLGGGNDGLNTVIPYTNTAYYDLRPNIAISENSLLPLTAELGLHPAMAPLMNLWDGGEMAILQNVGYPQQDLSHFRSTDIWRSASGSEEITNTGWIARFLQTEFPDFITNPPENPMALQQASSNLLLLTGDDGVTGVIVDDPASFAALVNSTYDNDGTYAAPETVGGDELTYVRQIDALSFAYADVIQQAAQAGMNTVEYPNTGLGNQLSIIARVLSGGMYSPFFLTHQYGYDTHADQPGVHTNLLTELSAAIASFYSDLSQLGIADRVMTVTTSEFGRRPFENGSNGTDHGAAAPHFFFGPGVNPGIFGSLPDFDNIDENNNLVFEHDFRQVYSTLLKNWFSASNEIVSDVLSGDFQPLSIIQPQVNYGDSNLDGTVNILDIVLLVDFVLGEQTASESQFINSDMNQDGILNILDIILVIDQILQGRLNHTLYSNSKVQLNDDVIRIPREGGIAGIQLELSGNFTLGDADLPQGWEWHHNENTILGFSREGTEMSSDFVIKYTGELIINNVLIADWNGDGHSPVINGIPGKMTLYPVYPNPFNPAAAIKFYLTESGITSGAVYDIQGRIVAEIFNKKLKKGFHEYKWTPNGLASGTYYLRLMGKQSQLTQKLSYIK